MVMLPRSIFKQDLVRAEFLTWTKYPVHLLQYGPKYGSKFYEHSSQYYSVEKYEMAYSGHITPVSPEESWVVPVSL